MCYHAGGVGSGGQRENIACAICGDQRLYDLEPRILDPVINPQIFRRLQKRGAISTANDMEFQPVILHESRSECLKKQINSFPVEKSAYLNNSDPLVAKASLRF